MSKVDLESTVSTATAPKEIADELLAGLSGGQPKLVAVFASADRDQAALARELRGRLPKEARLVTASTKVPIARSGNRPGAVVLAALSGDLEVGLGLGTGLSKDAVAAGAAATAKAASQLGARAEDLDLRTTVGLVIDDGPAMKKEELLLGVLDANPGLSLVGGGASDMNPPGMASEAVVGVDGDVAHDGVVVALIKTRAKWAALRHHAYRPSGERIVITKVDDTYSRALEIDGKPAAKAYADLLGVDDPADLEFGKPRGFAVRPTAMRVGKEYFLRAPWSPLPDGSILFANRITENTELELMTLGDFGGALQTFLRDELPGRVGGRATAAIYFNCMGRYFMAQGIGATDAVDAALAAGPPGCGTNAVFELFNGFQINSTLTALAFGEPV
jgi:hypothetical protein